MNEWPLMKSPLKPVLIVAGDIQQADYWYHEGGLGDASGYYPIVVGQRLERLDEIRPSLCREVFFVGTWERVEVWVLAKLGNRLESHGDPQATYVCDPHGEVIAPKLSWWKWRVSATRRWTTWHLPSEDAGLGWTSRTRCGLLSEVPLKSFQVRVSPAANFVTTCRYGPPLAACGVCAYEASKLPPGSPEEREADEIASAIRMRVDIRDGRSLQGQIACERAYDQRTLVTAGERPAGAPTFSLRRGDRVRYVELDSHRVALALRFAQRTFRPR